MPKRYIFICLLPVAPARRLVIVSVVLGAIILVGLRGVNLTYAQAEVPETVVSEAEPAEPPESGARIVRFPQDRSLGVLKLLDRSKRRHIESFFYWIDNNSWYEDWGYLGLAQGDAVVPADKWLGLSVDPKACWDLSPLQELAPDDLHTVSFASTQDDSLRAGDGCMPHIAHLTGLRVLNLGFIGVSRRGLQFIKNLTALERLTLPEGTNDAGLAAVVQLPSLQGLYFKSNMVTNAGLEQLARLTSLEELELGGDYVGDEGLVHLAKLPSLEYLRLWGRNFSDVGLSHVRNIPSLKTLHLGHLPITDTGLMRLADHPSLERLNLWNTLVTDDGLLYLQRLPSLKMLDLGKKDFDHKNPPITDKGMAYLKEIKTLEYFSLFNMDLTDKGLADLAELPNLRHLLIPTTSFVNPEDDKYRYTDEGLRHLSRLRALEELFIVSPAITDEGLAYISSLHNLKRLSIRADSITNDAVAKLARLRSLTYLSLQAKSITLSALFQLNGLPNLTELHLWDIRQDDSGLDISGLKKLEKIAFVLGSTGRGVNRVQDKLRDEDLACLVNLTRLKWLQGVRGITDAGMADLTNLTAMERLDVGGPGVTDHGLSCLANMRRLDHLTLMGNFTDEGLRHLEKLDSLTYLTIHSDSYLSETALQRLRNELPNLRHLRAK